MTPHAAFVVVYLLALIGIGAYKARSIQTPEDFSLAGRGLPTWVLIGTLLATWIGTGSVFGNAEKTFRVGLGAFLLPIAGSLGVIALYFWRRASDASGSSRSRTSSRRASGSTRACSARSR